MCAGFSLEGGLCSRWPVSASRSERAGALAVFGRESTTAPEIETMNAPTNQLPQPADPRPVVAALRHKRGCTADGGFDGVPCSCGLDDRLLELGLCEPSGGQD